MAQATLEHANYTVSDPAATAAWMEKLFGWHIRWQGDATLGGKTVHVGTDTHYLALYTPPQAPTANDATYGRIAGLKHNAVVVEDLESMERKVQAQGFQTGEH